MKSESAKDVLADSLSTSSRTELDNRIEQLVRSAEHRLAEARQLAVHAANAERGQRGFLVLAVRVSEAMTSNAHYGYRLRELRSLALQREADRTPICT